MSQPLGMLRFKDTNGKEVAIEVTYVRIIEETKGFGEAPTITRVWTDRNEYRETPTPAKVLIEEYEHLVRPSMYQYNGQTGQISVVNDLPLPVRSGPHPDDPGF